MEKKQDKDEYLRGKVPQRKTTERIAKREDGEETGQRQVSQGQGSTSEDNREIANREDGKEAAQG